MIRLTVACFRPDATNTSLTKMPTIFRVTAATGIGPGSTGRTAHGGPMLTAGLLGEALSDLGQPPLDSDRQHQGVGLVRICFAGHRTSARRPLA